MGDVLTGPYMRWDFFDFLPGCRAIPGLGCALADATEDDPSHDKVEEVGSKTHNCSAAADLNVVCVGA